MGNETNQKFVLPKEVKRDNRRDYISRELRRVYLVEQNFFFLVHATPSWTPRQMRRLG